jgi:RND family efflux transporter MFP subunit
MERVKAVGRVLLVRVAPLVLGLVLLIAVIAYLAGVFTPKIPPGESVAGVRRLEDRPTATVRQNTKDHIVEAVGKLGAADRTFVASKLLATIEQVTVNAGEEVRQGEILVRLESDEYEARLQQAKEALAGSQARQEEARTAFDRMAQLQRTSPGAITQGDYDQAVARYRSAEAEGRRLQQEVAEAQVLLSYAEIKAPKSGRIVKRLAEPGDTATRGQPLLEIYDARSLRLEAPVPEQLAVTLKLGDPLTVRIDALNEVVEGTVDEIEPQADVLSRSFLIKVALPESDKLYEGMSGRLLIPTGKQEYLCLDADALRHIGQLEFVDVVRDDDTLDQRLVKTGREGDSGRVEVLSGVRAGERVVVYRPDVPPPHDESDVPHTRQGSGGER